MAIRIEHGRPETMLTAAQIAGRERAAKQQLEVTERLQAQQREFEYRTAIRQQDMAIDLQMQERAKLWEIDKMQLRSQMDFQREEQKRGRIIDDAENAILQIKKGIKAGEYDEDELQVKNLLLYYELQTQFPEKSPPTGLIKPPKEDPMDAIMRQFLEKGGIEGIPGEVPTGRIRVISPEGQTGTIGAWELETYKARGFRVIGEAAGKVKERPIRKPIEIKTTPFTREFKGKF